MVKGVMGIILLDVGLIVMLFSYLLIYGLGLMAGLIAAVAAPLMVIGIWLDRTWARTVVFAVGMLMGFGWVVALFTWD